MPSESSISTEDENSAVHQTFISKKASGERLTESEVAELEGLGITDWRGANLTGNRMKAVAGMNLEDTNHQGLVIEGDLIDSHWGVIRGVTFEGTVQHLVATGTVTDSVFNGPCGAFNIQGDIKRTFFEDEIHQITISGSVQNMTCANLVNSLNIHGGDGMKDSLFKGDVQNMYVREGIVEDCTFHQKLSFSKIKEGRNIRIDGGWEDFKSQKIEGLYRGDEAFDVVDGVLKQREELSLAQEKIIRTMAHQSHEQYKDQFPVFEDFLSALTQNWIRRKRVFDAVIEKKGLVHKNSLPLEEVNQASGVLVFTHSGSWVLHQPGEDGVGKMAYIQADYKSTEESGKDFQPGAFTREVATGSRIKTTQFPGSGMSPAQEIAVVDPDSGTSIDMDDLLETLQQASLRIDRKTGLARPTEKEAPVKKETPHSMVEGINRWVKNTLGIK
mgnify:CR=1 FL=1